MPYSAALPPRLQNAAHPAVISHAALTQAATESGNGVIDNKTPAATRKKITQPQRSRQVEAADDIAVGRDISCFSFLHGTSLAPCASALGSIGRQSPAASRLAASCLHIAVLPVRYCPTAARRYNPPRTRGRSSSQHHQQRGIPGRYAPAARSCARQPGTHCVPAQPGGQQRCGSILTLQAQQTSLRAQQSFR